MPAEVPPVLVNGAEVQRGVLRLYPPDLLAEGVGGRVEIWVRVDTAGRGWSGAVKTSSGDDDLDCAAMRVGDTMEFEPAKNEDQPAEVWISEWVEFRAEAVAQDLVEPGQPPCQPWDTWPVALEANDIERWLAAAFPREVMSGDPEGLTIRSTLLALFVEETGAVREYIVEESSGYDALDDAAGVVAMRMRFEPAKRLGRPTGVWVRQPISFQSLVPTLVYPRERWRPSSPPFGRP